MQPQELKKELKAKFPKRISLIGREESLKELAVETIITTLVAKGTEDFNIVRIDSEKPTRDNLTELLQEPFSSDYKVAVIKSPDANPFWT